MPTSIFGMKILTQHQGSSQARKLNKVLKYKTLAALTAGC
jgi:hypothetical protein